MKITLCSLLVLITAAGVCAQTADLVVYGGTAGGAITAISGARQGLRVTLLEPRKHIGGMVTGGLSRTDVGRREVIGGYSLEFRCAYPQSLLARGRNLVPRPCGAMRRR